ncbi:uncharacterized protein LOC111347645 isoform X2 [Stylophora pistillata]|uniref:uncharacterized protein LOC111347645 isoform X2 n=1 Tax=Stylophora pistillata TaxID=50429 RepID=UPI000C04D674|nr:uncharacterized protein LOC111347645 isoform X2 [Stylophora pistillata]
MALPVEEKRWLVLGIALNKVLAPVLRRVVKQEMEEHYKYLDKYLSCQATPCTLKTLTYVDVKNDTNFRHLKFENINQNKSNPGKNKDYDYHVNHPIDLVKLYLPDHQSHFSAFDESFGVSAPLLLLTHPKLGAVFNSQKSISVQSSAESVRKTVWNKWARYNLNDWTQKMFSVCFSKINTLVESLRLTDDMRRHIIQELSSFEGWDIEKDAVVPHKSGHPKEPTLESSASSQETKGTELPWAQTLYRAGTDKGPSFEVINDNEVWLLRNPALYYPLDQEQHRPSNRANPVVEVRLWKTFVALFPDTLMVEPHPSLEDVVVVKLKETQDIRNIASSLNETLLKSLPWKPSKMPICKRGVPIMNVNFLARAVSMYLKDNSPVTPEEYNFQAELKAASHWRFLNENEQIKFVSGPYDYEQVKVAAAFALRRWIEELSEIESGETDLHKVLEDDRDASKDNSSIEERISDLEEDIFSLRMFYNMTLEEKEYKSSPRKAREDRSDPASIEVKFTVNYGRSKDLEKNTEK